MAVPVPASPSRRLTSFTDSAGAVTVVIVVAELLGESGSVSARETAARFVIVIPPVVGTTTIVTVAFVPPGIVPRLQVTTPAVCVYVPCEGFADTKVAPAGRL